MPTEKKQGQQAHEHVYDQGGKCQGCDSRRDAGQQVGQAEHPFHHDAKDETGKSTSSTYSSSNPLNG